MATLLASNMSQIIRPSAILLVLLSITGCCKTSPPPNESFDILSITDHELGQYATLENVEDWCGSWSTNNTGFAPNNTTFVIDVDKEEHILSGYAILSVPAEHTGTTKTFVPLTKVWSVGDQLRITYTLYGLQSSYYIEKSSEIEGVLHSRLDLLGAYSEFGKIYRQEEQVVDSGTPESDIVGVWDTGFITPLEITERAAFKSARYVVYIRYGRTQIDPLGEPALYATLTREYESHAGGHAFNLLVADLEGGAEGEWSIGRMYVQPNGELLPESNSLPYKIMTEGTGGSATISLVVDESNVAQMSRLSKGRYMNRSNDEGVIMPD